MINNQLTNNKGDKMTVELILSNEEATQVRKLCKQATIPNVFGVKLEKQKGTNICYNLIEFEINIPRCIELKKQILPLLTVKQTFNKYKITSN